MLETPESFNYVIQRKNVEDWAISRQLLIKFFNYQIVTTVNDVVSEIIQTKLFKKALRDLTPHTQTANTAGDEKVQTTTPSISG